jgi:hypothetical protein
MAMHRHHYRIPAKYYKAIGQVIVGWNLAEARIASIIWKIYKIKDVRKGRVLIYWLSAANKMRVWAYSAKHFIKSPAIQEELRQLQKRASDIQPNRNFLAHGLWGKMPNEDLWKVFKMDESDDNLMMPRKEVPAQIDPIRVAQDIRDLNTALQKFMIRNRIPPP